MSEAREMQKAAIIMARAAELNARVAGMVARNKESEIRGEYPAFDNDNFESVISEVGCHWNDVCETLTGY